MIEAPWARAFPRLFEIYKTSDCIHPLNYFNRAKIETASPASLVYLGFLEWEHILAQLDPVAWECFKSKAVNEATPTPNDSGPGPLFDTFHEARGYAFLKQHGFTNIEFIPTESTRKTPEMKATGTRGYVLLEAKRLHTSDQETAHLGLNFPPMQTQDVLDYPPDSLTSKPPMQTRAVLYHLPEGLKKKLVGTIEEATEQLLTFPESNVERRILYLSIALDSNAANAAKDELLALIEKKAVSGVEILHHFETKWFL